jgi:hypothetical protein
MVENGPKFDPKYSWFIGQEKGQGTESKIIMGSGQYFIIFFFYLKTFLFLGI